MATRHKAAGHGTPLRTHTGNTGPTVWRYLAVLVLLLAGFSHMKSSFLIQIAQNRGQQQYKFSFSQTDPVALTNMARREHLVNGDLEKAKVFYRRALNHYILYMPAWLGLAELFNDQGEKQKAVSALEFAEHLSGNGKMAWPRALLANMLEREDILTRNLTWLVENRPDKRKDAFSLADMVWHDPLILVQKFGAEHSPDILQYYIQAKELEKTKTVWQLIEKAHIADRKYFLNYVNYLLGHREFELASTVWRTSFNNDDTLLYNGDLKLPFIGSGFGWRFNKVKGVSVQNQEEESGLQISFDGSENVSFHLSQTVSLAPGSYVFSGTMQAESISTDQRPFWSLRGLDCKNLYVKNEMVPSELNPTEFNLQFTVPESCRAVQVSLQRRKSSYFDNKISGTLRMNKLSINRI